MNRTPYLIISITHREEPDFITFINVKALDGSKHTFAVEDCVPRFWTEQEIVGKSKSKMTSIDGNPLWEVRVSKPSEIRSVASQYFLSSRPGLI